jgi:hypothetical protein
MRVEYREEEKRAETDESELLPVEKKFIVITLALGCALWAILGILVT